MTDAIEAAAKRSYKYEGDRRGIHYIGWENEPEKVREEWRASVRVPITAYLRHFGPPVDLREAGATNIQSAFATTQGGQSSDGVAEGSKLYASPAHPALGCQVGRNGKLAPIAKPVAGVESRPSGANEPTPGPWAYEYIGDLPPGRTRSDRPTIAIVGDFRVVREGRGYDLHSSDEDDARLIAAAPETAAERDRLREHSAGLLSAIDQFEPDIDDYDDEVLFRDLVKPALERLRAALSCAKGGPA